MSLNRSTFFNMTRDINGFNGFGLVKALGTYNTTLAAGVAQSFNVPGDAHKFLAIMSYDPGLRIFVNVNAAATLPGGSVALGSDLNPTSIQVIGSGYSDSPAGGTSFISCITPDATAYIVVRFYALFGQ